MISAFLYLFELIIIASLLLLYILSHLKAVVHLLYFYHQ